MLPDGPQALDDFLSRDRDRIVARVQEMLSGYDRDILTYLVPHLNEIETATRNLDLGGGIVTWQRHLGKVLDMVRLTRDGICLCNRLPDDSLASVYAEERKNLIEVIRSVDHREEYSTTYVCRCRRCGQDYVAEEQHGWHVPTYTWRVVDG